MKTEKIVAIVIVLAIVFKYGFHFAGSDILLILSLTTLSMIYLLGSFYFFSYKGLNNQKFALSTFSGMAFSITMTGILFKLMYWKGSMVMLQTGLASSIIMVIVTFILSKTNKATSFNKPSDNNFDTQSLDGAIFLKEEMTTDHVSGYFRNMKIRGIVITSITLLIFLTPLSTLVKIQCWDDPEKARLKTRMLENGNNEEYRKEYQDYLKKE